MLCFRSNPSMKSIYWNPNYYLCYGFIVVQIHLQEIENFHFEMYNCRHTGTNRYDYQMSKPPDTDYKGSKYTTSGR